MTDGPGTDTAEASVTDTGEGPVTDTAEGPVTDTAEGPANDTAKGPVNGGDLVLDLLDLLKLPSNVGTFSLRI